MCEIVAAGSRSNTFSFYYFVFFYMYLFFLSVLYVLDWWPSPRPWCVLVKTESRAASGCFGNDSGNLGYHVGPFIRGEGARGRGDY